MAIMVLCLLWLPMTSYDTSPVCSVGYEDKLMPFIRIVLRLCGMTFMVCACRRPILVLMKCVFVCVYVCIYVCVCVHMCVCVCVCVYVCMYVCVYICVCVCV